MAYSSASFTQIVASIQPAGPSLWIYNTADSNASVDGANYISNGYEKGLRANDLVLVFSTSDGSGKIHRVSSVQAPADPRSPGNTSTLAATLTS